MKQLSGVKSVISLQVHVLSDVFSCFSSLPMCYRFSHRVNFQRATYPSSPPTFSTGSRASHHTSWLSSPLCSLQCWEQETRGIWELFFSWTQWECVGCTLLTFCFFPFFFFCHSGIFVLLKITQGWTKPESVLFDHFSAVFLFIGVLF